MKEEPKLSKYGEDRPAEGPLVAFLAVKQQWAEPRAPSIRPWEIGQELSAAMDISLQRLADSDDITVVAVGGYGRQELSLHSDIDLLLLHNGHVDVAGVRKLLYALWDAGLKVGHALRTIKETQAKAREDLTVLCGLLSARLIAGPAYRHDELEGAVARLLRTDRMRMNTFLAAEEAAVWNSEPYLIQNADLKQGRGGLRSLHRLQWDRKSAQLGENQWAETEIELEARQTLLSVRAALHAAQRRAYDRYATELRKAVGSWLGREPLEVATEVYRAMRTVDSFAGLRWGRVQGFDHDPIASAGRQVIRFVRDRWQKNAGAAPATPPLRFARNAALDGHGRLSPWEFQFAAATDPQPWSSGDRAALVSLLASGRPGWDALMALWEAGWLTRNTPELGHLRGLAQAAPFHGHPVDAHLGRTVSEVLAIADGAQTWCAKLVDEVGALDEVLLSAVLHDAGKGLGGNHSEVGANLAHSLLTRIGFGSATAELVSATVRHHLLLPETAFRKDIEDPQLIRSVAAAIGDIHRLHVLTLVSIADARATGADSWSEWRGTLLRSLHGRIAVALSGEASSFQSDVRAQLESHVSQEFSLDQVESHLNGMPATYLLRFGAEKVADHLRLVTPLPVAGEVRVSVAPGAPVSTVVVAAIDRPGLLATVAGVFALHNLGVLEARVVTRTDGLAIDTFRVVDTGGSDMIGLTRWPAVREHLEQAALGGLDLQSRVSEKRAAYSRGGAITAPSATVVRRGNQMTIEVRAKDRIGLLHDLATAMHLLDLDIQLAKIDTRGPNVIDVIEAIDHAEPSPKRDESIRKRIEVALV